MSLLIPIDPQSFHNWKGLSPHRFQGTRKHIRIVDNLSKPTDNDELGKGRKHYEEKYALPKQFKSSLRIFPYSNKETTKIIKYHEKLHRKPSPTIKKPRAEKLHLKENKSGHFEDKNLGIKTFKNENENENQYYNLEEIMGKKQRVDHFSRKRNLLPVRSLGDKIYKHPDYSSDFFKGGGLIPGSNIAYKKRKKDIKERGLKIVHYSKNNVTWKEKLEMEQKDEDRKTIEELGKWEENVLAEANPNWKDPDKVELPDLFAEREEKKGKDNKKPPPKK